MTTKISVGVVGAGIIARQSHLPVLTTMPQVRVAWITDSDAGRCRALARAYRLRAVPLPADLSDLPPCDVALLAIPLGARPPYIEAYQGTGVALFIEKPFARDKEAHVTILSKYPAHLLGCALLRRTFSATAILKRVVDEAPFGRLVGVNALEGNRTGATRADRMFFDQRGAHGGGILAEGGVHALDQVLFITGAKRHEVLGSHTVIDSGVDRKAEGMVRLTLASGDVDFEYRFSWLDRQPNTLQFEFEEASLVASTSPDVPVRILGGGGKIPRLPRPEVGGAVTSIQAFRFEWREFLRGVMNGEESVVSAASCLSSTALVEDLYREAAPL